MDYYLKEENAVNRLVEEWNRYGKIIIAYDFDDTVYDFHQKGRKYDKVINLLKRCCEVGAYFIVFTSCNEQDYPKITNYLNQNKIPFDTINDNLDFIPFTGIKVYYNILLDDRAGLQSAYECLLKTVKQIEERRNYNEN